VLDPTTRWRGPEPAPRTRPAWNGSRGRASDGPGFDPLMGRGKRLLKVVDDHLVAPGRVGVLLSE
jgi:hypothetical protein